jgi:hypothetical protein
MVCYTHMLNQSGKGGYSPMNPLTPCLSGMSKGARMQAILRGERLLGWGVSLQHAAGFHDSIRQSNRRWAPRGRYALYQAERRNV